MEGNDPKTAVMAGMKAGEAARDSNASAKLHAIHIRKAHPEKGKPQGYIAEHHYQREDGSEAHGHPLHRSEHVLHHMAHAQAHLQEHMGETEGAEDVAGAAETEELKKGGE